MKISVNSVKQFLDFDLPVANELAEKIGAQLAAVEEIIEFGSKYQGIPIVRIVSCVQHPNADRLKVCIIDDGGITPDVKRDEKGHVQVVCGAPNAREGITVVWLPPGIVVPETADKDPFTLEARELRGVVSNGMLASPKELGLGDSHEGILEIDEEVAPGTLFADKYNLNGDVIVDMENKMFTHRPDLFGSLGIAREIAGIYHKPFKSPEWYRANPDFPQAESNLPLQVINELPELVPRFTAITISDVAVGQSPLWLQVELAKLGLRPINNIVDLTNYYMVFTGQPLHAYDYDKVKALSGGDGAKIIVRYPNEGEKITLLNGKEIEPRSEAIMIATDQKAIGIGGVMGGGETEVDETTKNIILECATFDMYSIRRTSMQHGLFTDAVTRFNKGQSPLQNLAVLRKIVDDILHLANGKIASELTDEHLTETVSDKQEIHASISITVDFINTRLGIKLEPHEIIELLNNVEFKVSTVNTTEGARISVSAPFWRTDIEIPEDVVEEVGRLYGYDHLPLDLPQRSVKPVQKDALFETKAQVRETLSKAGANEVLTYSFVHGDLLRKASQNPEDAFQISNALSPDLQYYRLSLLPSLLEKIHLNVKAGYDEFALFEIGKTHVANLHQEDIPNEFNNVAFVYTASDKISDAKDGAAFYYARAYVTQLLDKLGVQYSIERVDFELTYARDQIESAPFEASRLAYVRVKGHILGFIGEFNAKARRSLKLPKYTAGFELNLDTLNVGQTEESQYVPLSRFPKVTQDITLKVPADKTYQEVYGFIKDELEKNQPENSLPILSPVSIYQPKDDESYKNITFRLNIASYEKTMRDEEVNKLLDELAISAKSAFGAERI